MSAIQHHKTLSRPHIRAVCAILAVAMLLLGWSAKAFGDDPTFGLAAFDGLAADSGGNLVSQAGGHPAVLSTAFDFNLHTDPNVGPNLPVEDVKDVTVDLPPGLVGSVAGLSQCTASELANGAVATDPRPLCPATSQIGTLTIRVDIAELQPTPVFNMVPPAGVPARFGVNVAGAMIVLDASVIRTAGVYRLRVRATGIPQALALNGNTFTLWGVPSDPSHDSQRACPGQSNPGIGGPTCASGIRARAFFRTPTSCTGSSGLLTTLTADSWQHPDMLKQSSFLSHEAPGYPLAPASWGPEHGTDGCERVPFDPTLGARPIVGTKAGTPAGFAFDLEVPQSDDPTTIAQSDLKKAVVTLPPGVRVSPSSADGLGACSSAQIALDSTDQPTCPDSSKVGTVQIDTPLLDDPALGNVYLATPFDNPFNSLVAVYIVASVRGVVVKLPGQISLDPNTGQITATFDNNPQIPFSRLHLEFNGGPRAPLVAPTRCDRYTTSAVLTGWNGRTVRSDSSFTLTENSKGQTCPSTFSPGFSAGTESNSAGSSSPFVMRFTREDTDQDLSGLTVDMPRGLLGRIAKVDLCTDAQASANACPAGAKIGDVTVGAGAGTNPFFITNGRAYLTGPYKGAPFGASIVVPAVAGPFDLGTVTTRAAVFVDRHDATVRIVSDPLPTILQGIPLDVRDVRVNVNKPDFWLNPTSCAEKRIGATLTSTEGAKANVSDRFQAADCASLAFKPKLTLRVGGRGHTARNRTTPFTATLTMPRRGANLRFVRVVLPTTINARLTVINDACTRAEFDTDIGKCAHARAGTAKVVTPLLRGPLQGNAYFVKNGHPIPDLVLALRGQISLDVFGRVTIPGGKHLANTFETVPDAPFSRFTLTLLGDAKNGSVGAAANLCSRASRRQKTEIDYIGQNGKVSQVDQALKVSGCAHHKAHRTRRKH